MLELTRALGALLLTGLAALAQGAESGSLSTDEEALVEIALAEVASGLVRPVSVAAAPGDDGRLFVVEQRGRIRTLSASTGAVDANPWLDLSARTGTGATCDSGERGLLGLAFHPDFEDNGWFFLNYTEATPDCDSAPFATVIARFTVSAGEPDPTSAVELLRIEQPFGNHNGGELRFGPDGLLYIAMGDGGGGGDPLDTAQNPASLLGKMLRIDVDRSSPGTLGACGTGEHYGIPPNNPFSAAESEGCAEIWALGLRNPYRFSIDAVTGQVWIGDVGQRQREEVSRASITARGVNFGWDCREGTLPYGEAPGDPDGPAAVCATLAPETLRDPLLEYRTGGSRCSVIGGFVYRGPIPLLRGVYLAGDFCSGELYLGTERDRTWRGTFQPGAGILSLAGFGADSVGRLYVVDRSLGRVLRVDSPEQVFFGGFERDALR